MATLNFTCPFCKKESHEYETLTDEGSRRSVPHDCTGVSKRSYVFVDKHTPQGIPIYLRCNPAS